MAVRFLKSWISSRSWGVEAIGVLVFSVVEAIFSLGNVPELLNFFRRDLLFIAHFSSSESNSAR